MNDEKRVQASQPFSGAHSQPAAGSTMREFKSEDLLQGAAEILIRHGRDHYRLRATSKGKLILTK
jgi:hemin uptake protein HemP